MTQKKPGPKPDPKIKRYVIKLTLYEDLHAGLIDMIESADAKGPAIIDAMLSGVQHHIETVTDDTDDGFGDLFD